MTPGPPRTPRPRRSAWRWLPALLLVAACADDAGDGGKADKAEEPAAASPKKERGGSPAPAEEAGEPQPERAKAPKAAPSATSHGPLEPAVGTFASFVRTLRGPVGVRKVQPDVGAGHVVIARDGTRWRVTRMEPRWQPADLHYVTRDERGRVVTWEERTRWGLLRRRSTYEHAADGAALVEAVTLDGDNAQAPCHARRIRWDVERFVEESTCLDRSGRPIEDADGVVTTRIERYRDAERRLLRHRVHAFDAAGKPIVERAGYHTRVEKRDDAGCVVEETYLAPGGGAAVSVKGVHRIVRSFGPGCRATRVEHFDADGHATKDEYGVHRYAHTLESGLVVRTDAFGTDGEPVGRTTDKVHSVRNRYSPDGKLLSTAWFDDKGDPMAGLGGHHLERYTYTDEGRLESKALFDVGGRPVSNNFKVHKYFYVRNKFDQPVMIAFYNKRNRRTRDAVDRVYMLRHRYDEHGRRVATSYWRSEGKPMRRWSGIHELRYGIGEGGRLLDMTAYDAKGQPAATNTGWSRQAFTYDAVGRWVERAFFKGEEPVAIRGRACINGYHAVVRTFDDRDRVVELAFLNAERKPVDARLCLVGARAARVQLRYRAHQIVEERLFKVGGAIPVKTLDCRAKRCVNLWGNQVRKLY